MVYSVYWDRRDGSSGHKEYGSLAWAKWVYSWVYARYKALIAEGDDGYRVLASASA